MQAFTGSRAIASDYSSHPKQQVYLDEADGSRLFTEALTAEVESVLADETSLVGAVAAGVTFRRWGVWSKAHGSLTTDGCPYRTSWGERTKRRRGSF